MIYPRFNRQDIAIVKPFVGGQEGTLSPDVHNYVNFTEHFKGHLPLDSVISPFNFRPTVPYLASILPVDSLLGIVFVNIFAAIIAIFSIYFILKHHHFEFGLRIIGCLLFIVSFPMMYYTPAGYIDASAICMISLITAAAVSERYYFLPLLFMIGAGVKEVTIIAFPFIIFISYRSYRSGDKQMIWPTFISVFSYVLVSYLVRTGFSSESTYVWEPMFSSLQENLIRPKTYLSFLLSFGLVGVLGISQILSDIKVHSPKLPIVTFLKNYVYTPHLLGILASFALNGYAVVSAYADGRFIWTAYPFLIPPAIEFIKSKWMGQAKTISS